MHPARTPGEWENLMNDMFGNDGTRLMNLPPEALVPWTDANGTGQPFRAYTEEKLEELTENIRKNGVIEPICVRPLSAEKFQIIAGHNRVEAARRAGLTVVPALSRSLTDEEAAILMVDSNLQHREILLPSEKAFAYKLKLDALSQQGKRTDLTSTQVVSKLRSNEIIGQGAGESRETVRRYIRLTYLIPGLLKMVDDGKMKFMVGVQVSYLSQAEQSLLLQILEEIGKAPSAAQAAMLREASEKGTLDEEAVRGIMIRKKPPTTVVKIPAARISSFFPADATQEQIENEIIEALTAYRNAKA